MLNPIHHRGRQRGAATIVEFAFVAPLVLTCIFGCLEWCRYISTRNLAENAVREGARYAVCRTDIDQTNTTVANITQTVKNYINPMGGNLTNINVYVFQVNSSGQPIDINGTVITLAAAQASSNEANWYQSPFAAGICVTMTATYSPIVPGMLKLGSTLPMQITVVMGSEGN